MKNKIKYILSIVIIIVTGFSCKKGEKSLAENRPNIIFIMSDDHAVRTISAYDGSINDTPNLDRLADEGAIFLNSFCSNSICGPSRASILTGKHGHKNGVTGNGAPWDGKQTLFPRIMKNNGYSTVLFGKWHLNSLPGDEFDLIKVLTGAGNQGFYYNPLFYSPEKGEETEYGYSTDLITDKALEWLEQNHSSEKPFMLFVQYKAPHVPRMPAKRFLEKYINETIPEPETLFDDFTTRSYYATQVNFHIKQFNPIPAYGSYDPSNDIYLRRMTIEQLKDYHAVIDPQNKEFLEMKKQGLLGGDNMKRYAYQRFIKDYLRIVDAIDENVGRILNWLDEKESVRKNTVVVYCSDQGYFTGEHGYAEKRLMYEEALMMPLLIRWPGIIRPGTIIKEMIQNIDYGPTFLDMAGIEIPNDMQGRSFRTIIEGTTPENWRKSIYYHYYDHGHHVVGRHDGVRTKRYKLINFYTDDVWEMYDLENDNQEVNNVYGSAEYLQEERFLKEELSRLRKYYDVPEWVFKPPYVSIEKKSLKKAP